MEKKEIIPKTAALVIAIYTGACIGFLFKVDKTLEKQEPEKLRKLRPGLERVSKENDPFLREYILQEEAVKSQKTVNDYRLLFESYRKNKTDFLPDYPKHKWSILAWLVWFCKEVSNEKKFELVKSNFLTFVEKGALAAGVIAAGKWLLESPQRKRQELYQAWQIIHLAKDEIVSEARKEAFQNINKQKISLAELVITPNANLENINLEKVNLTNAILMYVNLSKANLKEANLRGANLRGANLREANLREANLLKTNLTGADLTEADLIGADLIGADLTEADLVKTNLTGANLFLAKLSKARIASAIFFKADLKGVTLVQADLIQANFAEANLEEADFRGAILYRANFTGANLREANLREANLTEAIGITSEQIQSALGNDTTILPDNMTRPGHWISS